MKHRLLSGALLTGVATITIVSFWTCTPKGGQQPGGDSTIAAATPEHGKYLVKTMGCGDCHTPWTMGPQGPAPDMSKMLSGHPSSLVITEMAKVGPPWMGGIDMTFTAFSGPWGVSFTANLTPDSATGLGAWSQATFMTALRTGKHLGNGRPIMPPMPWPAFTNLTDCDLASIYQYLRTIPAISNKVPDAIMNPNMGMAGSPPGAMPAGVLPPPGGMPPGAVPPGGLPGVAPAPVKR